MSNMLEHHDVYNRLWKVLDIVFDWIVIFSIAIVAIIGVISILFAGLDMIGLNLELPIEVNYALKTALNTIIVLKTYETLKLFVSTNHASVENILELGLIGLSVKIFFDTANYLNRAAGGIFVMLFACYIGLKRFRHHEHKKDLPQ